MSKTANMGNCVSKDTDQAQPPYIVYVCEMWKQNGTTTQKSGLAVSNKGKHIFTLAKLNTFIPKCLHKCSQQLIHNCQKLPTIHMSFSKYMDKQTAIYPYIGHISAIKWILLRTKTWMNLQSTMLSKRRGKLKRW